MQQLPHDTDSLVAYLDAAYPAKCPKLDESERAIFFYAGRRALIEELKARLIHEQQNGGR